MIVVLVLRSLIIIVRGWVTALAKGIIDTF